MPLIVPVFDDSTMGRSGRAVVVLTIVFTAMWLASAWLFRTAARQAAA